MDAVSPMEPTIGEIARRTGYPAHRIEYLIRTRRIKPKARAGHIRVFAEEDIERITLELRRMDERRVSSDVD